MTACDNSRRPTAGIARRRDEHAIRGCRPSRRSITVLVCLQMHQTTPARWGGCGRCSAGSTSDASVRPMAHRSPSCRRMSFERLKISSVLTDSSRPTGVGAIMPGKYQRLCPANPPDDKPLCRKAALTKKSSSISMSDLCKLRRCGVDRTWAREQSKIRREPGDGAAAAVDLEGQVATAKEKSIDPKRQVLLGQGRRPPE